MNTLCLVNKDDKKLYDIYDITYDKKGYAHFLIYKDEQWVRMRAKHFKALEAEDFL